MTEEEKKLLLIDLSERLLYGVKVKVKGVMSNPLGFELIGVLGKAKTVYVEIIPAPIPIEEVKPYLRPLSSMSEEEKEIYRCLSVTRSEEDLVIPSPLAMQWLLSRHFDINHLIEKELAVIAPEGMY